MRFKSLSIWQYRNIPSADLDFEPNVNIFIGPNGQGKTNVIEALYVLRHGQSFRYSNNSTLIQIEKDFSLLRSTVESENLDFNLQLKMTKEKKEFLVNGKKISPEKAPLPSMVLFSPESLSVIKESAEERRNLIDEVVGQIYKQGNRVLTDFKKALKTRNRLLKDILAEKIDRHTGLQTLHSLNPSFLKLALELTVLRLNAIKEIRSLVEVYLSQIHGGKDVRFDMKYTFSDVDHTNSDMEILVNAMQKRMSELESAELQSGVSLVGPQKHDIVFLYSGNDSRFFCSQGQQRSIILAFKMAQIVYHHRVHGFYPVLLLDDVLSELDLNKQESLISTLNQTETQTFVTTTDVSLLSKLSLNKTRVFKLNNGQIILDEKNNLELDMLPEETLNVGTEHQR